MTEKKVRQHKQYGLAVIGASSGGIAAITRILSFLPPDFSLPILVVIHQHASSRNWSLVRIFKDKSSLRLKEADDKEKALPGTIYFAPPNYHLLVEEDMTLTLNVDEKVNFSRPSIDVLFESAAEACRNRVIGIILSGASHDGAAGLKKIMDAGGLVLIQDPAEAEADIMPRSATAACNPDRLMTLDAIGRELAKLGNEPAECG